MVNLINVAYCAMKLLPYHCIKRGDMPAGIFCHFGAKYRNPNKFILNNKCLKTGVRRLA